MISDLLGDIPESSHSHILSSAALEAREGIQLQRGLNFRDDGVMPAVFLVLARDGEYHEAWDGALLRYRGHDSETAESKADDDQLMMYASGRLTENGKFYKAAMQYKDGVRKDALTVQVYEKLEAGAWFDKGLFDLIEAQYAPAEGRRVFTFSFAPRGALESADARERMLPAARKAAAWTHAGGRCEECAVETDLHFAEESGAVRLLCAAHAGREKRGFL